MKRLLMMAFLVLCTSLPGQRVVAQATQADSAAMLLTMANALRAEGHITQASSLLDLILQRYPNSPAAEEARRLRTELGRTPEERSGKTELLVWTTTYGLILGALVPLAAEADDPEPYGVGMIAGGPTGFLLGRAILNSRPVSEGQARAISFGTLWGLWQGLGWAFIADDDLFDGESNGADWMLAGSLAGFGTGLLLSQRPITAGTSTMVSFGGLWGTFYGICLAVLTLSDDSDGDDAMTMTLMGGNVGVLATMVAAPRWQLSRGRARLINISGLAALFAGSGILLIAQSDDEDANTLTLMSAATAGLALGAVWTKNYDERQSRPDGPGGDALLNRTSGRWSLNLPAPAPRLLETRRAGRPGHELGVAIPILRASFQ